MTQHLDDDDHDPIFALLGELDPISHDAPPAVGSPRFMTIKENAMKTIARPETTPGYAPTREPVNAPSQRTHATKLASRRVRFGMVAAGIALVASTVLVIDPGGTPPAQAFVLGAADNLAQYDSLRATLVREEIDGSRNEGTAEFDGAAVHTDFVRTGSDGDVLSREGITVIGDTIWTADDGELVEETIGPNDRLTPFPEASQAVVAAALQGSDVELLGIEDVQGTNAERYRILQTDESRAALNELTPFELAWFELESPDDVTQIDVWIADDLIQQITVVDPSYGTTTTTFYDFGADIDIQPPTD